MTTKFHGNGALNRTLRYITSSYEHDCKLTKKLPEGTFIFVIAWFVLWGFFLIKVLIYTLHIIPDLLTGHALWTPEIRIEDLKSCELTELLRREKRKTEQNTKPIYNPHVQHTDAQTCQTQRRKRKVTTQVVNSNTCKTEEAMRFIQGVLQANRNILKGLVLSTVQRKIPEDELLQFTSLGYLEEPAFKQYVSFGSEINEKLHDLLINVPDCKFTRKKDKTCFVLNNGDYTPIVNALNQIFNQTNIKINLTGF